MTKREANLAATKQQVILFLNEFKFLIERNNFHFVPRLDQNKTVISIGLTKKQAKRELLNLSLIDYSSGPKADKDQSGEDIWIFGKEINRHEVYIKLRIYVVNGVRNAKCISFHEADDALRYPYKNEP